MLRQDRKEDDEGLNTILTLSCGIKHGLYHFANPFLKSLRVAALAMNVAPTSSLSLFFLPKTNALMIPLREIESS